MWEKFSLIITSVFGLGFLPFCPGTFGSLFPIAFVYFLQNTELINLYMTSSLIICFFISIPLIKIVLKSNLQFTVKKKCDPSYIVIDEVIGQLISLIIVSSFSDLNSYSILISFLTFRLFDIIKPYPIGQIEKKLEQYEKFQALSIVLDDILAGVFSGVVTIIIIYIY